MKSLPNIISFGRILLVAPTLYFLWQHDYRLTLVLFLIAGISDGIDGFLARHFNWRTRLGTYLDPIGDKLLLVGAYWVMGLLGHIPMWLVVLVMARDIIIVIGATLYRYAVKDAAMQPLLISKINTVMQIVLVVFLLYQLAAIIGSSLIQNWLIDKIIIVVAVTTVLSGMAYIMLWWQRIIQSLKTRHVS